MPYPREHAARIVSPGTFQKGTFRSKSIKKGIRLILAKKCRSCSMQTQAVRFNVCQYTSAQAKAWLKKHGYKLIRFEPATGRCER